MKHVTKHETNSTPTIAIVMITYLFATNPLLVSVDFATGVVGKLSPGSWSVNNGFVESPGYSVVIRGGFDEETGGNGRPVGEGGGGGGISDPGVVGRGGGSCDDPSNILIPRSTHATDIIVP